MDQEATGARLFRVWGLGVRASGFGFEVWSLVLGLRDYLGYGLRFGGFMVMQCCWDLVHD